MRETIQKEQRLLLNVGSVNERVQGTELPDNEWSALWGIFPDFTGEQARIWGKRALAKYANAIYGIYQFWTPLGYAAGIYQYTGTVDFGKWTTTSTKLDLTIPTSTNFDGGNISLDDFGQEFNRTADVSSPNVCTFNFSQFLATHQYCGLTITGANLPNDSNGSPAGQGKKCKWTNVVTSYNMLALAAGQLHGTATVNTSAPATNPPFVPNPIPLPPVPSLTYIAGSLSLPFAHYQLNGTGILSPPTQFFGAVCENWITSIDFTSALSLFQGKEAQTFATVTVGQSTNGGGAVTSEFPLDIDFSDPVSYAFVTIDASNYLPAQVVTHPGNPVGSHSDQLATLSGIKLYVRQKVCT